MNKFGIGQPVPRVEDPRFITGRGRYVDDFELPHQCYGVVVMSPHAHARIKRVDTAKAKAAEGVLAVLTGADVKADQLGGLAPPMPEDMGGPKGFRTLLSILAIDKVRAVGERVAFVVAETLAQAKDAAELIAIDYEPLPAVITVEDAVKPGAPALWDEAPNNVAFTLMMEIRTRPKRPLPMPSMSFRSSSTIPASPPIRSSRAPRSATIIPIATATRSIRPRRTRTGPARRLPAKS